jgi:phosphoribosylanthranilate isomerase
MPGLIKICGVTDVDSALAAAEAGADLLGFVFFHKSPRAIAPEAAEEIVTEVKRTCYDKGIEPPHFVGLFVDAGEKQLAETAPFLTHFQFHGREDAGRVAEIGAEFAMEMIKALPIAGPEDLAAAAAFEEAADMLLLDARPPAGAERPGGHGAAFDWSVLQHYSGATPFLLAGGLEAGNVAAAIAAARASGAFAGVDVSSGVETRPGVKDAEKIKAFIAAARGAL